MADDSIHFNNKKDRMQKSEELICSSVRQLGDLVDSSPSYFNKLGDAKTRIYVPLCLCLNFSLFRDKHFSPRRSSSAGITLPSLGACTRKIRRILLVSGKQRSACTLCSATGLRRCPWSVCGHENPYCAPHGMRYLKLLTFLDS